MITQTQQIDLIPNGEPVIVHVSQYDNGARTLAFQLFNGGVAYAIPGSATVTISGTKPDGTGFQYAMGTSGNTASIDIEQQMALLSGDVPAEITITDTDGTVSSANFIIRVEKAALDQNTVISQTDIPVFTQLATRAETAAQAAAGSATQANTAKTAAEALIPATGTAGQVLTKTASGTAWGDIDALPAGGTAGQVLTKQSATDGDANWEDPTGGSGTDDLLVTITYANSAYSADKTFAEIEQNIADGGFPVLKFNTLYVPMTSYSSGSLVTFTQQFSNGGSRTYSIDSNDTVYVGVFANQADATNVTYSNTTSGLSATNVQSAIDEVTSNSPKILSGTTTGISTASNAYSSTSFTFSEPFDNVPAVVASLFSNSTGVGMGYVSATVYDVSITGFSVRIFNKDTQSRSPAIQWIAIDQG